MLMIRSGLPSGPLSNRHIPKAVCGKKLQAQDPIRTEAFGEGRIAEWKKEEAALTGLEERKLF